MRSRNIFFMVFALAFSVAAHADGNKKPESDWVDPPQTPTAADYTVTCVTVVNNGEIQGLLFVSHGSIGPMTQVIGANGAPATCNTPRASKRN